MKKTIVLAPVFVLLAASLSQASNLGFDLNINVGNRPREVAVPVPASAPPPVVVEEPPQFILPPQLGFYVAVGVPYDMFYISNNYYLFRGNVWYRASGYDGPWVPVRYQRLPPGLRRHRYEEIRTIREAEYRRFRGGRDYHGKFFRPERERRRHEHEQWKEERGRERDEWRGHGHGRRDD